MKSREEKLFVITGPGQIIKAKTGGRRRQVSRRGNMGRGVSSRMWLLCLLLSMKMILAQSNQVPSYGLFIPPDLYHLSENKFCMECSRDLLGYTKMSVDLQTSAGSVNLYTVLPDSPTWHCQSFQVPEPSGTTEKVTIAVHGYTSEGTKVEFSSKELTIRKKATGTLMQTDKSTYKRGQKVMFRMLKLTQDMEVLNETYPLVEIRDPQKNRVAQYKDVSAKSGIAEGSYQLSPDAALGKYNIKAGDVQLGFTVQEYILPRFDLKIDLPSSISVKDEKVPFTVSALYTYGEKVVGNVTIKVSQKKNPRPFFWLPREEVTDNKIEDLYFIHTAKTDSSREMKLVMPLSHFNPRSSDYARQLDVAITMEEEGTGVKISAPNKVISLKSLLTKLTFKECKSYYQPGGMYRGKLLLESYDGKSLSGKKVHLSIPKKEGIVKETYTTDSVGEASFQLQTSEWTEGAIWLQATTDEEDEPYNPNKVTVSYGSASLPLEEMYMSTNKSSVNVHSVKSSAEPVEDVIVTVEYTSAEELEDNIEFFYLVMDRNRIIQGGQKTVKKPESRSGSLEFTIPVKDMSQSGQVMVFMKSQSGEIAADSTEIQGPGGMKHKVSMKFEDGESLPGSDNKLHLQANGGSMCAMRAVDKSVVMMKPEAELTESKIKNLVPLQRSYITPQGPDYRSCDDMKLEPFLASDVSDSINSRRLWGGRFLYPKKKMDLKNIIEDMGMHILTSWDIAAPTTCKYRLFEFDDVMLAADSFGNMVPMSAAAPFVLQSSPELAAPAETPAVIEEAKDGYRTYFPETLLFDMQEIPDSGSAEVPVKVPDTMTEWTAQMLCAGREGLGLSSPTSLKVFQPFFVELTLPYSIIREEIFTLKASVFNYQKNPMMIRASLPPSDQFKTENSKTSEKHFCLPGGKKETVSWDVTPTYIGQMNITVTAEAVKSEELCGGQETLIPEKGHRDVVIQSMLVVPEGSEVEQTHNNLMICNGTPVTETVKLELPSTYVQGSQKAFISVCGDIMGPSMNNIGDHLKMSYGCGEQNMAIFAPNIFILGYMKKAKLLNPTVQVKCKDLLEQGFAQQMKYKHKDGSYSAFGKSDPEGSTWLTGFVTKSLNEAKDTVFIDPDVTKQGMDYLKAQQEPNGCFKSRGRLLNNGLKGGVGDQDSLSAYVLITLLKAGLEPSDPIVAKALSCIQKESLDVASVFKLALKGYAFTLAKDEKNRAAAMEKLQEKAIREDGLLYWTQEAKSNSESSLARTITVEVEVTAYVLLIYTSFTGKLSRQDRGDMLDMSRWLTKQQNANGGFSSTQDTVVALEALAEVASLIFSEFGNMALDVTSKNGFHRRYQVNDENRLLLQKDPLPDIPGEYTITASGKGSAIVQVTQVHNVLPAAKEDAFTLSAKAQCGKDRSLRLSLDFSYIGKRNNTNMCIMEVNMLSGHEPQEQSLKDLEKNPMVNLVEKKKHKVSIYIDKVTSERQNLEIHLEPKVLVHNMKAATLKISDYYMPDERKIITYLENC